MIPSPAVACPWVSPGWWHQALVVARSEDGAGRGWGGCGTTYLGKGRRRGGRGQDGGAAAWQVLIYVTPWHHLIVVVMPKQI